MVVWLQWTDGVLGGVKGTLEIQGGQSMLITGNTFPTEVGAVELDFIKFDLYQWNNQSLVQFSASE